MNINNKVENHAKIPTETERKFLIRMPDPAFLATCPGARFDKIRQVYLRRGEGGSVRIRRRACGNGEVRYTETRKRRVSGFTCEEYERDITGDEYNRLLSLSDPTRRPIEKTRWCVPFGERLLEIDIYPFWTKTAILEIELPDEAAAFSIPDWLSVIREVSREPAYRNASLACRIPPEE